MNILICLIIIVITGIFLMKRYQPQPILIGMGILMMYIAYEGNWINAILDESQSTGVLVFDAMDIVRITTSENIVSLGLMIMTCAGYAKYMEHIGAGTRLAHTFIKPLYRLNRPYIVLALMFLLNMGLSICTESVESCFAYDGHHLSRVAAARCKSCRRCCSYCYRPFDGCWAWCGIDIAHSQDT